MFTNCASLTNVPNLPAATLAIQCYHGMFSNCTGINVIECESTDPNLFLSLPSDLAINPNSGYPAVYRMFSGTINAANIGVEGTPVANKSYKIAD